MRRLAELALMARLNIPLDVTVERRPPESVSEGAACGVVTLVAKVVVRVADEGEAEGRRDVKLMSPIVLQPPKPVVG